MRRTTRIDCIGAEQSSLGVHDFSLASVTCPDWDDDEEALCLRDVWVPTGPALRLLELETAFWRAGYMIRKIEISPHSPPVLVLRLIRRTVPRYSDQAQFVQHICQVLESVGIDVPKVNLVTEQRGSMVLVAFIWQPPAPDSTEAIGLDELLALLP